MFKTYIRLLKYIKPYKKRFFIGLFFAFLVSVFNGLSLTAMKPIFDILGSGNSRPFQLEIQKTEFDLLCSKGYKSRLEVLVKKSDSHYNKAKPWLKNCNVAKADLSLWKKIRLIPAKFILKINEYTIDKVPIDILIFVCLAVLPIYFLKLFSMLGTVFLIASTGLRAVTDIREELYQKMQQLPMSQFVQEKTGVLMSRIINDVGLVSDAISHDLRISINSFFLIVTHVFILAMLSYQLLFICFFIVPLILWPVNHFAKKIKHVTAFEQTTLANLNGHLQEVISGIRVIRAFVMEAYELGRFRVINNTLYKQMFRYRFFHTVGPAIVELATSLIIVGLLIYGGSKIAAGEFTSGSFLTFLFTLMVILSPIKQMASWFNLVNRTVAAGERIFSIIDQPLSVTSPVNPIKVEKLTKSIQFNNVNFNYPDTDAQVLQGINIDVPIGSTVALVGHSGAGKSTLVDMIPRFYDVSSGDILFDSVNIKDIDLEELRLKIGVVTQEIFLFNGSVRENIAYGRDDVSEQDIINAAKMAFADEFISAMPEKYDTQVGERGLLLSGGQRQRLSIARALLKDPEILILDEATSALDTESERLVQQALEKLMQNRTTFVIAHRLSTIYQADVILVMKDGLIIERGTHQELLDKGGQYKTLYQMQFQES